MMLQQDQPDDYVISTGETHSVQEFAEIAFGHVGLDYRDYVVQDERFMRPAEVDLLIGDPTKARESSAGSPASTSRPWCSGWLTPTSRFSVATGQPVAHGA